MEPNDGRNGRKIGSGPRPEACLGDKCGPGLRGQNEDEKGLQPPHCQAFKIKITPNNSRRLRLKRPFTLFVNPVTVFHNYHSSHTILEWKFLFSLHSPKTVNLWKSQSILFQFKLYGWGYRSYSYLKRGRKWVE